MDDWEEAGVTPPDKDVDENIDEVNSERSITGFKTAEEIEKLTVDEQLDDVERIMVLLRSGNVVQQASAIEMIPECLKDSREGSIAKILPRLKELVETGSAPLQRVACHCLEDIGERKLLTSAEYASLVLPSIVKKCEQRESADVNRAWLEALLKGIPCLTREVIKSDLLDFTIAKGHMSKPVQSRLGCCRLLGAISAKLDADSMSKDFFQKISSLCQDTDYDVRVAMCMHLDSIARGAGLENTKKTLIPELVELTNDEEVVVRLASFQCIVDLITFLDKATLVEVVVPIVCRFVESAHETEGATMHVASLFGKIFHRLHHLLNEHQTTMFLDFYRSLATHPSSECHRHCAYNMPAVILVMGASRYPSELHSTFSLLVQDFDMRVRKIIASAFHEFASIMPGDVAARYFKTSLSQLLEDKSSEVIAALLEKLNETFANFAHRMDEDRKHTVFLELLSSLLSCEGNVRNKWRLQETIMQRFKCLPDYLPSDTIYAKIVPIVFQYMGPQNMLPVREAAAEALCVIIRANRKADQRREMCRRILTEFGKSNSSWNRSLFVDICRSVCDTFSRKFFKETFYEHYLDIGKDVVPNLRIKMCPLLPMMKSMLRLPADRNLVSKFNQTVDALMTSNDRDVVHAISILKEDIESIEVTSRTPGTTQRAFMEDDLIDQRREEEELRLLQLEEHDAENEKKRSEERIRARIALAEESAGKGGSKANLLQQRKSISRPPTKGQVVTTITSGNALAPPFLSQPQQSGGSSGAGAGAGGSGTLSSSSGDQLASSSRVKKTSVGSTPSGLASGTAASSAATNGTSGASGASNGPRLNRERAQSPKTSVSASNTSLTRRTGSKSSLPDISVGSDTRETRTAGSASLKAKPSVTTTTSATANKDARRSGSPSVAKLPTISTG
eukprot:Opistho-2@44557